MAIEIQLRRHFGALVPASEADQEKIADLPAGVDLRATIVRERSGAQLRLYWGICNKVAKALQDAGDEAATREQVSERFKVHLGLYRLVPLGAAAARATGQTYAVQTQSISFHKMEQADFNRFINRMIAFTLTELLPHIPSRAFRAEIATIIEEASQ